MGSTTKAAWYWDIIRELLASLDKVGYSILGAIYKIFYMVATATIISGDLVRNFYGRIQLILGIFMIFKLAMSILNIIISPESLKDTKGGPTKMITRTVVAIFMLLLIIPLNLNLSDEERSNSGKAMSLNAYVYDHGILFGFLYKFQDSMMRENIMGKLILGTTGVSGNVYENDDLDQDFNDIDANNLSDVGRTISAQVAKTFIRPNVKNEAEPYCYTENDNPADPTYDPDTNPCPNVRCPSEVYNSGYTADNLAASSVVGIINTKCYDSELGKKVYAFTYMPVIGAVTSIFMAFVILGFTVDVAVRAIKLAILRLIAPIPIISYIDPKSEKDGAFGNWTKSLISTYIDLFVRLGIIFFGAFLLQSLFSEGTFAQLHSGNALIDAFSKVAIIIGVLVFMKQAPTFLKNALGIKGQPMGNAGLSGLLGGTAMAIGGGGLAGFGLGMMQGMSSASDAAGQGKAFSPFSSWSANRDQMAKIRTGDKDARGGIIGGTMDRLLYNTRERQLGLKGLSYENVERAKDEIKEQQKVVDAAKVKRDLSFENLKRKGITGPPPKKPEIKIMNMKEFMNSKPGYYDRSNTAELYKDYSTYATEQKAKLAQWKSDMDKYDVQAWNEYVSDANTLKEQELLLGSMEKNYKTGSEARNAMGTNPRMVKYSARGGYRKDEDGGIYNPYNSGRATKLDDVGLEGISKEIGASPGSRS